MTLTHAKLRVLLLVVAAAGCHSSAQEAADGGVDAIDASDANDQDAGEEDAQIPATFTCPGSLEAWCCPSPGNVCPGESSVGCDFPIEVASTTACGGYTMAGWVPSAAYDYIFGSSGALVAVIESNALGGEYRCVAGPSNLTIPSGCWSTWGASYTYCGALSGNVPTPSFCGGDAVVDGGAGD